MKNEYDVTMMGVGAMGGALASVLLEKGFKVAVWNRSAARGRSVVEKGATFFDDAHEAVLVSPVVMFCVSDYAAANEILEALPVGALAGKTVVQLSSGGPEDAIAQGKGVEEAGGNFMAGGIMAQAGNVGHAGCMILYSGRADFQANEALLMALGGASRYLGQDPASAIGAYLSLGTFFTSLLCGFSEALHLARAFGIAPDDFLPMAKTTVSEALPGLEEISQRVRDDNFSQTFASVVSYAGAAELVEQAANARGAESRINRAMMRYFQDAVNKGFGELDVAVVDKVM